MLERGKGRETLAVGGGKRDNETRWESGLVWYGTSVQEQQQ